MLPTLILSAPHAGILYINGRFAGEVGPEEALIRPVGPRGALYLDYRPLSNDCRGLARKLVFSGGEPLVQSAEEAEGLDIVLWPGGVTELELAPEPCPGEPLHFQAAGRLLSLESGGRLFCEGRELARLPLGAQQPEYYALSSSAAFLGRCEGGNYLLTVDAGFHYQTGFLRARQIEIEPGGAIHAVVARGDQVGHATLESWRLTPEGLTLIGSEPAWADGAPRWPVTAAQTARAAVEAALAGLDGEAEGYLSPALRAQAPLSHIRELCDLCVEMKYSTPDPRPCIGLLRLETANLARVRPLYYRAIPTGTPQSPYQLDLLTL